MRADLENKQKRLLMLQSWYGPGCEDGRRPSHISVRTLAVEGGALGMLPTSVPTSHRRRCDDI